MLASIISNLCNKSAGQLNPLTVLSNFLGLGEERLLMNSSVYENSNNCLLMWHFSLNKPSSTKENLQKRALFTIIVFLIMILC